MKNKNQIKRIISFLLAFLIAFANIGLTGMVKAVGETEKVVPYNTQIVAGTLTINPDTDYDREIQNDNQNTIGTEMVIRNYTGEISGRTFFCIEPGVSNGLREYVNQGVYENDLIAAYIAYSENTGEPREAMSAVIWSLLGYINISDTYKQYELDFRAAYEANPDSAIFRGATLYWYQYERTPLYQRLITYDFVPVQEGAVQVMKYSASPNISNASTKSYSLAGAEFGLYSSQTNANSDLNRLATLTTGSDGKTNIVKNIELGTYWIKEIKAPKGYLLNTQVKSATIEANTTTLVKFADEAKYNPLKVMLTKLGDSSEKLAGAEFDVRYYADIFTNPADASRYTALKSWKFRTGSTGSFGFQEYQETNGGRISGDSLFVNGVGNPVAPIGTYVFKEVLAPTGYKINPTTYLANVKDDANITNSTGPGATYNPLTINNKAQKMRFTLSKQDLITGTVAQAGTSLVGAVYELRAVKIYEAGSTINPGDLVKTITTGTGGKISVSNLPLGIYDLVETKPSPGYSLNPVAIRIEGIGDTSGNAYTSKMYQKSYNHQTLTDFYNQKIEDLNELNRLNANGATDYRTFNLLSSKNLSSSPKDNLTVVAHELAKYGRISLSKHMDGTSGDDLSTESGSKQAESEIKFNVFNSKGNLVDTMTTDSDGRASSKWLPIGKYRVSQASSQPGFIDVEDFFVTIEGDWKEYHYKLENFAELYYLQIVKLDSETKKEIAQEGVSFEIYDSNLNKVVQTITYPSTKKISQFVTGENGLVQLPEKLTTGTYYIREIKAPSGYYLDPSGEDLKVVISGDHAIDKVIVSQVENIPQKGQLTLTKTGSILVDETLDKASGLTRLTFKDGFLAGSKWTLTAKEDIYSLDKQTLLVKAGTLVDTLVTTDSGPVLSKLHPLGTYVLEEKEAPLSHVRDAGKYEITFSPQVQDVKVHSISQAKYNIRKDIDFNLTKTFETTEFFTKEPQATFGLFLAEDYSENGVIVNKDSMLSKITVTASLDNIPELDNTSTEKETEELVSQKLSVSGTFKQVPIDGKFYIKELSVSNDYILDQEKHPVSFDYANTNQEHSTVPAKIISNELKKVNLVIAKTEMGSKNLIPVAGAKYKLVAVDQIKGETTVGEYITNSEGKIQIEHLPKGNYFLEEVEAPTGYIKNEGKTPIDISKQEHGSTVNINLENEKIPFIKTNASDATTGKKSHNPTEIVVISDKVSYKDLIVGEKYYVEGTLMDKSINKPLLNKDGKPYMASHSFVAPSRDGYVTLNFHVDGNIIRGKTTVVFEDLYKDGKLLYSHRNINDINQTTQTKNPNIGTKFAETKTQEKDLLPLGVVELTDYVDYKDLVVGDEYELKLVVMNKETNKPLLDKSGKMLVVIKKFIPKKSDGQVKVSINLDLEQIRGLSIVAFEELSFKGQIIASHKDINDGGQTIVINNPRIFTKFADVNDKKEVFALKNVNLIDHVEYKDLVVGKEYELKMRIAIKGTNGFVKDSNGQDLVVVKKFVADNKSGTVLVEANVDLSKEAGREIVAFERLYYKGVELAVHEDINDANQTIKVKELPREAPKIITSNPKTGDRGVLVYSIVFGIALIGAVIIMRKNKTR